MAPPPPPASRTAGVQASLSSELTAASTSGPGLTRPAPTARSTTTKAPSPHDSSRFKSTFESAKTSAVLARGRTNDWEWTIASRTSMASSPTVPPAVATAADVAQAAEPPLLLLSSQSSSGVSSAAQPQLRRSLPPSPLRQRSPAAKRDLPRRPTTDPSLRTRPRVLAPQSDPSSARTSVAGPRSSPSDPRANGATGGGAVLHRAASQHGLSSLKRDRTAQTSTSAATAAATAGTRASTIRPTASARLANSPQPRTGQRGSNHNGGNDGIPRQVRPRQPAIVPRSITAAATPTTGRDALIATLLQLEELDLFNSSQADSTAPRPAGTTRHPPPPSPPAPTSTVLAHRSGPTSPMVTTRHAPSATLTASTVRHQFRPAVTASASSAGPTSTYSRRPASALATSAPTRPRPASADPANRRPTSALATASAATSAAALRPRPRAAAGVASARPAVMHRPDSYLSTAGSRAERAAAGHVARMQALWAARAASASTASTASSAAASAAASPRSVHAVASVPPRPLRPAPDVFLTTEAGPADDITAAPPAAAPATAQADAADGDLAAAIYESLLSLAEELGPALPAGASPAQLAAVPRVPLDVVMSAGSDSGAHCCPVCLEPFAAAAAVEVLILPGCGHMLHAADECGPGWLRTSRRCPTCRIDFADALVLP